MINTKYLLLKFIYNIYLINNVMLLALIAEKRMIYNGQNKIPAYLNIIPG